MSVFHTLYYATNLTAPAAADSLVKAIDTVDAAFVLAAVMVALCLLLLSLFRVMARDTVGAGIAS